MEKLTGTRQVPVKYSNGQSESIDVRAVPVRQMKDLMAAFVTHDEGRLIELYTGKKPEWGDALELESFELVLATGEEMNRDPFGRYARRMLERSKVLASLSVPDAPVDPTKN